MGYAKLDTNGYWAIDGTPIYVPSKGGVQIDHDNIVGPDSGRVESGKMHIDWVRTDVRKVSLTYDYLTGAEVEYMRNLMQGKVFQFTYYDNGVQTMEGYCGKNTYSQENLSLYSTEGGLYKGFKINVEEM